MEARKTRKLWSDESMRAAVESVNQGKGLREAGRLYNVPVETLRRRVTGKVDLDCRPGPATILTKEEEERIVHYLIQMADMGYGLTREAVMHMVYIIVEKCKRPHPFKNEKAGRWWFQGFKSRHPNSTVRMPQSLAYCRALSPNKENISDFFGKLGAIYGKLNVISKPMQIFNADETGVTIVHRPGKVIAELGRHKVYTISSAERGKTHTILSCVSASAIVLPPCLVFPRKRSVPDHLRKGAVPGTLFSKTESGWMSKEVYLEWFKFFLENIPPARPVVLIQDGHASHVSVELIELARANDIHLLCLPAHTSHILQPLDVGVFKSFKANFSKACAMYIAKNPGRVITTDLIASLIGSAWPSSHTPVNIMSGYRKSGVYPLNPGAIDDRDLAPSKAFQCPKKPTSGEGHKEQSSSDSTVTKKLAAVVDCETEQASVDLVIKLTDLQLDDIQSNDLLCTSEQERLYERRFQEGYDLQDPDYEAWVRINHPTDASSEHCFSNSLSVESQSGTLSSSVGASDSSAVLSEVLVLPKPKEATKKRKCKEGLNKKAVCITDRSVGENKVTGSCKGS